MALGRGRLSQKYWVQGVSAWNFDVAALKEQAAREGPDPPMPTISEAPTQAPSEGGPQSHPLKLPVNGPNEPGQGKRMSIRICGSHALSKLLYWRAGALPQQKAL